MPLLPNCSSQACLSSSVILEEVRGLAEIVELDGDKRPPQRPGGRARLDQECEREDRGRVLGGREHVLDVERDAAGKFV